MSSLPRIRSCTWMNSHFKKSIPCGPQDSSKLLLDQMVQNSSTLILSSFLELITLKNTLETKSRLQAWLVVTNNFRSNLTKLLSKQTGNQPQKLPVQSREQSQISPAEMFVPYSLNQTNQSCHIPRWITGCFPFLLTPLLPKKS